MYASNNILARADHPYPNSCKWSRTLGPKSQPLSQQQALIPRSASARLGFGVSLLLHWGKDNFPKTSIGKQTTLHKLSWVGIFAHQWSFQWALDDAVHHSEPWTPSVPRLTRNLACSFDALWSRSHMIFMKHMNNFIKFMKCMLKHNNNWNNLIKFMKLVGAEVAKYLRHLVISRAEAAGWLR